MPRFLDKLKLELCEYDSGSYQLISDFRYQSSVLNQVITVPSQFITDLASVPRIPFIYDKYGNRFQRSGVVHDYLYTSKQCSRLQADLVLKEAILTEGGNSFTAYLFYKAVRLMGSSHYE